MRREREIKRDKREKEIAINTYMVRWLRLNTGDVVNQVEHELRTNNSNSHPLLGYFNTHTNHASLH